MVFVEVVLFVGFYRFLGAVVLDFPDFLTFLLLPVVFFVFLDILIPVQAIIGLFTQCTQDFFPIILEKLGICTVLFGNCGFCTLLTIGK